MELYLNKDTQLSIVAGSASRKFLDPNSITSWPVSMVFAGKGSQRRTSANC
jgi:hypothetical protein